ncbi:MAG: hypothetical protein IJR14_01955 [Synergistaceae bacterium]|nr:hypothetical protein [Synergistaceae bacterium]
MANVLKIQIRRDTSENWATKDPVLGQGELGADLTQMRLKVGDGERQWGSLPFVDGGYHDVTIIDGGEC